MAISYRTRKFSIPLKVNKVKEEVKVNLASVDLDGETITLTDLADSVDVVLAFDAASSVYDGSLNVDDEVIVGIKNVSDKKEIAKRAVAAYAAHEAPDTLMLGYGEDYISVKQTVAGDVVSAVVSDAAKLEIEEIAAGFDGDANPDIVAGAATLVVDSSNLGFNPALDTLKLQVNCNDYEGAEAGRFDVSVRPAGSEVYAEASADNVAGTDVVIVGGQSNSIVFDGVKVALTGVTGSDANVYLTFISEEVK